MTIVLLFFILSSVSTGMYYFLHKKTHISLRHLYKDNIIVIFLSFLLARYGGYADMTYQIITGIVAIPLTGLFLTLIRFYRKPIRKSNASQNAVLSAADGKVIYVKSYKAGELPTNSKNGRSALLSEFENHEILKTDYWHVGINMTPLDVHRNSAPVGGKVILVKHFDGEFLSLKHKEATDRNERCSYLISNESISVGVVQIASRLVRRIDSYVKMDQTVSRGDWIGMIKFGSQVDMLISADHQLNIEVGQQLYAGKTVVATKKAG